MQPLTLAAARTIAALLSPAGKRARLTILIFHRVRSRPDPLFPDEVTAARFERQLDMLSAAFNLLPLPDAIARLRAGTLPARPACITFDDGYRDNAEVALPILLRRGVHATFFIATGFLDGGRMWNDTLIECLRRAQGPKLDLRELGLGEMRLATDQQRRAVIDELIRATKHLAPAERQHMVGQIAAVARADLPTDLMMSSHQVRALAAAGMEIGGHTVTHPILARISIGEARREIEQGRAQLRAMTDRPVRLFAYPNGKPGRDYLPEHAELLRKLDFDAALSTSPGVASAASDPFHLPRFTPWDLSETRFVWRAIANLRHTV